MSQFSKIRWSVVFILVTLILPLSCKTGEMEYNPKEVLIKFKSDTTTADAGSLLEEIGLTRVKEIKKLGVTLYKINSKMTVQEVIEKYENHPHIEYIEPNYQYRID